MVKRNNVSVGDSRSNIAYRRDALKITIILNEKEQACAYSKSI